MSIRFKVAKKIKGRTSGILKLENLREWRGEHLWVPGSLSPKRWTRLECCVEFHYRSSGDEKGL